MITQRPQNFAERDGIYGKDERKRLLAQNAVRIQAFAIEGDQLVGVGVGEGIAGGAGG
jgi:hypothetical protein